MHLSVLICIFLFLPIFLLCSLLSHPQMPSLHLSLVSLRGSLLQSKASKTTNLWSALIESNENTKASKWLHSVIVHVAQVQFKIYIVRHVVNCKCTLYIAPSIAVGLQYVRKRSISRSALFEVAVKDGNFLIFVSGEQFVNVCLSSYLAASTFLLDDDAQLCPSRGVEQQSKFRGRSNWAWTSHKIRSHIWLWPSENLVPA